MQNFTNFPQLIYLVNSLAEVVRKLGARFDSDFPSLGMSGIPVTLILFISESLSNSRGYLMH